jgi:hypothetical protein
MHFICNIQNGKTELFILFLITKASVSLNTQKSSRTELDTYVGDSKYSETTFL